jgi:hypothetical protein
MEQPVSFALSTGAARCLFSHLCPLPQATAVLLTQSKRFWLGQLHVHLVILHEITNNMIMWYAFTNTYSDHPEKAQNNALQCMRLLVSKRQAGANKNSLVFRELV